MTVTIETSDGFAQLVEGIDEQTISQIAERYTRPGYAARALANRFGTRPWPASNIWTCVYPPNEDREKWQVIVNEQVAIGYPVESTRAIGWAEID